MKESDLRKYVRKEILLQEDAGDVSLSEIGTVFDSFKNLFRVAKIAIKSLISSLVLNFKVSYETDQKKIETYFDAYDNRQSDITNEYRAALSKVNEKIDDFMPLVFLANPGAYLAYQLAELPANNFSDVIVFLRDVGVKSNLPYDDPADDTTASLLRLAKYALGAGPTPEDLPPNKKREFAIAQRQKETTEKINRLFGLRSVNESVTIQPLVESKISVEVLGSIDGMVEILKSAMLKSKPENFGISKKSSSKIALLKKEEAETMSRILDAPIRFLESMSSSRTIEEVRRSIEILRSTPFNVVGVEKLTQGFLDSSAMNVIREINKDPKKKDEKVSQLVSALGLKDRDLSEKDLLQAIKAYQLKTLLGNSMIESSKDLIRQIEDLRRDFIEKFEEDAPLELVSKVAPGSDLETAMKEGLEKIRNAGKRRQEV